MTLKIINDNIDDIFYNLLIHLKNAPEYSPRNQKIKELINVNITLKDVSKNIVNNKMRKINRKYIEKEIEWYKEATPDITNIAQYSKMWSLIAEDNKVNSNYGVYIWDQLTPENKTQYQYVIDKLISDKYSRQALININQVKHKYNTKDFPCTISLQYLIRNDKLISICNMRSNDIIYGFCNDVPFFTYLQTKIHKELIKNYPNLKLGDYHHNVASLHIYEKHYDMMHNCIIEHENI